MPTKNTNATRLATIARNINKRFADRLPCQGKAMVTGKSTFLRFEGPSLTIELAQSISEHMHENFPGFAPTPKPLTAAYHMGGTTISWWCA